MPILTRCEFLLGDTLVGYQAPEHDRNAVGLCLLPAAMASAMASAMAIPREHLDAPAVANLPVSWLPVRAWEVDPLGHVHRLDVSGISAIRGCMNI